MSGSSQETLALVTRLIEELCGLEAGKVMPEGKIIGYGLDSVRVLDLLMAVEDALDIELSENDPELGTVQTVADLAALVEKRR